MTIEKTASTEKSTVDPETSSLDLLIEDCGEAPETPEWPENGDVERCPRAGTIAAYDTAGDWYHAWETSCKTWQCPHCGPRKTAELCRKIEAAKPTKFITLTTVHRKGRTPREVWNEARRQISELAKKYRKELGEFEYARILEPHKSGYPHFHLVARSPYIPQEHLSRRWQQLTGAFIVDIRRVNPNWQVAKYVAKYLTKTMRPQIGTETHKDGKFISERRVSASRHFFAAPEEHEPSDFDLCEIRRFGSNLPSTARWEFPNADWEKQTPWHWISKGYRPEIIYEPDEGTF